MSDSCGEKLELSCRKYNRRRLAKQSKSLLTGLSKATKPRNDCLLDEFEPLLPTGHGGFTSNGDGPDDSSKVRQRVSKSSTVIDLAVGNPSINGIEVNGERSTDRFLENDFLFLNVKKGDTLQSLSLQYGCSVSDLKRANNLISNQEFYALRQLRIPVKKHGLLTERLLPAKEIVSEDGSASAESGCCVQTVNVGIGPISPGGSQEDAVAFFRKMDEDLVKIMQNTKSQKDSLEAATIALTSLSIQPLVKEKAHVGADCGIQWCYLVAAAIVVGLILPVIAFIYIYTQHHNENNPELQHNSDSLAQGFMSLKKENIGNGS